MNPCYFPLFYSGGGVLLPADIPNIAQWLVDYDGSFEYVDKADAPQLAKPINVGVPVLAFASLQRITTPYVIPNGEDVEFRCTVRMDIAGSYGLFSEVTGYNFNILVINNAINLRVNNATLFSTSVTTFTQGVWYDFRINYETATGTWTAYSRIHGEIPWVTENSAIEATTFQPIAQVFGIRATDDTFPLIGRAFDISITAASDSFYYPCEEGTGNLYDASGNNNRPTANTTTWTTEDSIASVNLRNGFSSAGTFNGSTDYEYDSLPVSYANDAFSQSYTLSTVSTTDATLFGTSIINDTGTCTLVKIDATGHLYLYRSLDAGPTTRSSTPSTAAFNDGEFHDIVLVFESDFLVKLYADGDLVTTDSGAGITGNPNYLTVGARAQSGGVTEYNSLVAVEGKFSPERANDQVDVIILAGQSNAAGFPEGFGSLPTDLQGDQFSKFWQLANAVDEDDVPIAPVSSTRWSVEIESARKILLETGRRTYYVKVAVDGTSLGVDWQKDGQDYSGSTLQEWLTSKISTCISDLELDGFVPTIRQFWWIQGDNDAVSETLANNYEANWNIFWNDFTTDNNLSPSLPVVLSNLKATGGFSDEVRTQQANIVANNSNVSGIDATSLTVHDGSHYDSASQQTLGGWFADEYLKISGNKPEKWITYSNIGSTTLIDNSGNGNDSTVVTSSIGDFWALYIPALNDGSGNDALGRPIAVRGSIDGALVHNGAPSGLRFEDAYYATNAPNRFHDGINPIDIYWPEIVAHPNGEDNSYQKSEIDTVGSAGQCVLVELGQYKLDPYWMPTPSDLTKNNRYWSVCGGFSASLVPAKVTAGTGIGPNLDWADAGDGTILLVEDA